MTLFDTISLLEQIALRQPNVRTAREGNIFDILNANPSVEYAAVIITQGLHQQDETWNHYRFTVFYADRLESDLDSNRLQVQSAGKEVLNNIIRTLTSKFDAECDDITYQPFTQRFADECAGVFASVVIDVPVDYTCAEDYADSDWTRPGIQIRNQIKSIEIESNGHYTVSYDTGYTGLEAVGIDVNVPTGATISNQDKKVSLKIGCDGDGTGTATVEADSGYTGLGEVSVSADATEYGQCRYNLGFSWGIQAAIDSLEQDRTYTVTAATGVCYPTSGHGYEGMRSVTVDATEYGQARYQSGYTEGAASVHCNLQHKDVAVTGVTMTISPDNGYDGLSSVGLDASDYALAKEQEGRQEAIESLENKTIVSNGTYSASTDGAVGWSSVTVSVPTGSTCNLQSKSVTYTSNDTFQVTPDEGYDGMSAVSVTVNVPQATGGTLHIQNGTKMGGSSFSSIPHNYDFSQVSNFGAMFNGAVNLQSVSEGDIDTSSGTGFYSMLHGCTRLTSVSGLDTSGATSIEGLVCRCTALSALQELDASSLEVQASLGLFWPDNSEYTNLTDAGGLKNLKISIEGYNWDLCPNLTLQSCLNILNGLYDFTGHGEQPGEGQGKLKVHQNFITLVGDNISIATDKGWQISA